MTQYKVEYKFRGDETFTSLIDRRYIALEWCQKNLKVDDYTTIASPKPIAFGIVFSDKEVYFHFLMYNDTD